MNLHKALYEWFGYSEFRMGQKEIIESLLKGKDVLAMLPTGTGKSICYQLPALLSNGLTLVISPLLSLMQDQVQELRSNGIKRVAALNGMTSSDERDEIIQQLDHYQLLYLSPEMLQSEWVVARLNRVNVCYIIVDEAHCISHWGKSFRTDYRKLAPVRKRLGNPPCLAITATATKLVQTDIIQQLELNSVATYLYSVDRPTIAQHVQEVSSNQMKLEQLSEYVGSFTGPGIIYFQTRKWAESASEYLRQQGHNGVSHYHGGMLHEDRLLIQQQFMIGQLQLICCTSAFGMGVNKSDIRYVIHFQPPLDLESYLQEIGRAGRDGKRSVSILLYNHEDLLLSHSMIQKDTLDDIQLRTILTELSQGHSLSEPEERSICAAVHCSDTAFSIVKHELENEGYLYKNDWKAFRVEDVYPLVKQKLNEHVSVIEDRLRSMWKWIKTDQCKRETILRYFSEELVNKPEVCCTSCGLRVEDFYRQEGSDQRSESNVKDWREQLNLVFMKGQT
ncbi:RecQ family ATP-dependent DNA helicase [Alkalicoccobacillus gibsonii]|uniref:RecQ family ATP-dependent DNA helicase n=1 Tax=Alkalicoccobacillus gibsonii TaxID=79881 RepID=UPI001934A86A|nr:ATP-dependent DNA helicase RecQ [Alkalicoccobacillus gibsonii]MBM0064602.1 ATP-dependent DNA helicase RecQ [Alkalicoccobacillus gibsonii]